MWSPKSCLLDWGKPHRLLGRPGLHESSSEAELSGRLVRNDWVEVIEAEPVGK